ncbi:hypothetical protein [Thiomicrorhabdus indica]|uniref:hypothetical protein n=1 Tax=Thiomicrorhabdus indica TaxID=2267253 RepID=UPI00102D8130|nr:hypothetical protein [Thiomicrorhabdus indica]
MENNLNQDTSSNPTQPQFKWYQNPLHKTLFWSFIWTIGFALLLPFDKMQLWYYSFLIGSVPSTLLWDWFNIQTVTSTLIAATLNALVLLMPYWYYRSSLQQTGWLYFAFGVYGFINAALGFTIIISMKNLAHL